MGQVLEATFPQHSEQATAAIAAAVKRFNEFAADCPLLTVEVSAAE